MNCNIGIFGIFTQKTIVAIQVENPSRYYIGMAVASSFLETVCKSNETN